MQRCLCIEGILGYKGVGCSGCRLFIARALGIWGAWHLGVGGGMENFV